MKIKLLNALTAAVLFLLPVTSFGQAPTLGTTANFVLFTTVGAVTNSGIPHLTHLTGNVGTNIGSSTGFGNVDGQMHDGDGVSGTCGADLLTLYAQLNTATTTFSPTSTLLGNGDTLIAGVYQYPLLTAASMNLNLILDAQGNPNALFIIKIDGAFSTGASSKVILANGALACNVFWKVEGAVNMATGTTMRGTIVAHNDAINMSPLDTLEGRALSINGAITTNAIMAYKPIGCGSAFLTGPAAPALVSTAAYGVFSSIGSVTSTPVTYVIGDVGSNSTLTTGFNPLNVTGMIHPSPDASTAACAGDLTNVYNYLNALPTDIELLYPALFGNDLVLTPHTYHIAGAPISLTGSIYLNAQGNPNAVFVINMNGAFITSTSSRIVLINGTQAKNVYWKIDGATHIYDNSLFNGTIVGAGAITLNTGDTLNGRVLTINGAVAINGSYVTNNPPPCVASTITGIDTVCVGLTTALSSSDTGRIWHSSNPLVATVDSVSGVVTGISAGTSIITLTTGLSCQNTDTLTVNPTPAPVTGTNTVCVTATTTFSTTSTGGTWTSSNTLVATVGSISGIVTGVAFGTANITYAFATGCNAVRVVSVNALPNAGTITGTSTVCPANTITLSNATTGGVWTSVNIAVATIGSSSGIVTGVTAGTTTISYTITNSCGTAAATTVVTVNPSPNAGTITGTATLCPSGNTTLSNAASGGVWTSVNTAVATIGSSTGIVTGVAVGTSTISYTVTNSCGTVAATRVVTVNATTTAGIITGTATVCPTNTTTLSNATSGGVWSSVTTAIATIGSSTGIVTGVAAGTTTISYTVTNSCGTAAATTVVTVNPAPNAGIITGTATLCPTGNTTLSNATSGGVWSSVNTAIATIGSSSGVVSGVTAGTSTISYTVTNSCGTAVATTVVTVNPLPNAGTITGTATVCPTNTTTLGNATTGGAWSSVTPAIATIGSSTGVVTGVAAGTTTISYTVTNSCGTAAATTVVTVNPAPNAGIITGTATLCPTGNTTLSNATSGGVWSSVNTAIATIGSSTGIVTGITSGTSTISYTVTNSCGTVAATRVVTVNATTTAGTITGTATVCPTNTTTLSNTTTGGVWSSVTPATATIGSSTGVVTGVSAGTTTISYTVTNSCGTAAATTVVTVNPLPNAGTITGTLVVCPGNTTSLSNTASGGTWTSVNTAVATIGSSTGVATGITAGTTTISYTVTNSCGTIAATSALTVNPSPNAGVITGIATVCPSGTTTLNNVAGGGVWTSVTTSVATIGSSTGIVTGVVTGTSTISYTVTNSCGTAVDNVIVTVNPLPNAGVITGIPIVCPGNTTPLSNTATGGIWSSTNTSAATINPSTGNVTGVATGTTNISYTVTNSCGTAAAIVVVTVNPMPNAGTITGVSSVCVGSTITLSDASAGGVWASFDATIATVGSSTGIVTGVTAGTTDISYTVNNSCGFATTTKAMTVNPLPNAGTITGAATVCAGNNIVLNNLTSGGIWTSVNNTVATIGSSTGIVAANTAGTTTISYTVSNICGTIAATVVLTVNPLPNAGVISGSSNVCVGSTITLSNTATGGTWSSSNGTATVTSGMVVGVIAGIDTIIYSVNNVCGSATAIKIIAVNPLPLIPIITTQTSSAVCTGTMYQNFGTSNPSAANTVYGWTAVNAIVWAQGTLHNYALVNFTTPGTAYVTLNTTISATGCKSQNTIIVTVGPNTAQTDYVSYFNHHFVCTPNNESSYQWGYDDASTLDSTILKGEINQDYVNANPDFSHKLYWVMTTLGTCMQKTYYKAPLTVQNLTNEIVTVNVFPNPAATYINVEVSEGAKGTVFVEVQNMMGQKVGTANAISNKATVDVSNLASGTYIITCYNDGIKISSTRFTKN